MVKHILSTTNQASKHSEKVTNLEI